MNIFFRTDAAINIGTGHVMRCLTLAEGLRNNGAKIIFICREHLGNLCSLIESRGYQLIRLPLPAIPSSSHNLVYSHWLGVTQEEDAREVLLQLAEIDGVCDWLIVDHYALGATWEVSMRQFAKRIMVIDDLADRRHNCDLLLDQNFYEGEDTRYDKLVPGSCKKLLSPRYAMLREEFFNELPKVKQRAGELKRILVFFGGSDYDNETLKALQAIHLLDQPKICVDVILGVNFPFKSVIQEFASRMNQVVCHDYVDNMAELMASSDLYLGAAGITTWERCCLGLPSLVIAVASNQVGPMEQMERAGFVLFLGEGRNVTVDDILRALDELMAVPSVLAEMSHKAMKLVDGSGTQRCVTAILNYGDVDEKAIQNYS
jgi:UDP-2,4-diacetamido-2,4,6-trideoxy-beta-L-altropyranose hydrolase